MDHALPNFLEKCIICYSPFTKNVSAKCRALTMDPMESSTGLASMALSTDLCSGVVGAAASLEAAGADSVGVGASKSVVGLSPLKTDKSHIMRIWRL